MVCGMNNTEGRTCILRSPLIADNFSWSCMYVQYVLSSYDVKLTLELLAGDKPILSHILLANETAKWMTNPKVGSAISLQFTASRYLVSTKDYEYAVLFDVDFLPCPPDTGKILCLYTHISKYILADNTPIVTIITRESSYCFSAF